MADNTSMAREILDKVGGAENVEFATHCMTRLRLNLKDREKVSDEEIKAIQGVKGVMETGDQYQIIIGQTVPKIYANFCSLANLEAPASSAGQADVPKQRITLKGIGNAILDYLSGAVTPVVTAIVTASLFLTIQAVLGPQMLGLIAEDSGLYILCGILFNAVMYFLPFFLAVNAAKKLDTSVTLALMIAGVFLAPTFVSMVNDGTPIDLFGLTVPMYTYSQTVLPVLLSVWILSYVERFFMERIPELLSSVFVPFLTILVMVPLALFILGPIGCLAGQLLADAMVALGEAGGIVTVIGIALCTALMPFLVMTGMHNAVAAIALTGLAANGFDSFFFVCNLTANFGLWGLALGAFLRLRNKADKGDAMGSFVAGVVGGVTEPALFGIGLKYGKTLLMVAVANFFSGLIAGIFGVTFYRMGATSFLSFLCFVSPDNPMNVVFEIIAAVVGFGLSTALVYFFGFKEEEIQEEETAPEVFLETA